jgi:hypothetical protein
MPNHKYQHSPKDLKKTQSLILFKILKIQSKIGRDGRNVLKNYEPYLPIRNSIQRTGKILITRKEERSQINNVNFYLKKLGKRRGI